MGLFKRPARLFSVAVLAFFMFGCGFFFYDDHPTKDPVPPPDTSVVRDDGKVAYTPPSGTVLARDAGVPDAGVSDTGVPDAGATDTGNSELFCSVETVVYETDPRKVSDTIDLFGATDVETFYTELEERTEIKDAEFVHLDYVTMYSLAGDKFGFLKWVKVYINAEGLDTHLIAWAGREGEPIGGRSFNMLVDGGINLKPYFAQQTVLKGKVRASAPSATTWIQAELGFLKFYDCE